MTRPARVLVRHLDAPWLPAGGRADVVLAAPGEPCPEPVCVVRLLTTSGGAIQVVPRPDGGGLDIPSLSVAGGSVHDALDCLTTSTWGRVVPSTFLGYVHNRVAAASSDYGWPVPDAFFAVWHCRLSGGPDDGQAWLAADEAEDALGQRHWWPLAVAIPEAGGPASE